MDNILDKTKKLISSIDNSELIKNLDYYKNKVVSNKEILKLIEEYNTSDDDYKKISLKEKIYKYEDYKLYMKYYNELFYYIMKINNIFKKFTNEKGCSI